MFLGVFEPRLELMLGMEVLLLVLLLRLADLELPMEGFFGLSLWLLLSLGESWVGGWNLSQNCSVVAPPALPMESSVLSKEFPGEMVLNLCLLFPVLGDGVLSPEDELADDPEEHQEGLQ